jgi:hypothetical protein
MAESGQNAALSRLLEPVLAKLIASCSRRHAALVGDAKALLGSVCSLPFAPAPAGGPGHDVLSDEQTLLVLALVRQAQETKVPKCAPVCGRALVADSRAGSRSSLSHALLIVCSSPARRWHTRSP